MKAFFYGVAVVLVACLLLLGVILSSEDEPVRPAVPNTAENVGKCIQGQRVYYHVTRGEAAETCLAQLAEVGERRFGRTWHNFKTELAYW